MRKLLITIAALGLLAASCGDSAETTDDNEGGSTPSQVSTTQAAGSDGGDGSDGGSDGTDGSSGGDGTTGSDGTDAGPDNDDAADIMGNPDLDLDALPPDVADALDDIDDVVSIGDCSSETVGLAITAPDGWQCRVLDQPVAGMDGFTLFTEGNQLNITIGTPSNVPHPCEVFGDCDTAEPISLSDNFPDTSNYSLAGTVLISGTHKTVDAELVITNLTQLTDDELALVMMVLDSAVEI